MIFRALRFAVEAHEGQTRKGTRVPYIIHPLGVAQLLIEAGADDEVVAAGLLHDVVEDTPVPLERIEREFGARVARLVAAATKPKGVSSRAAKQHTIDRVRAATDDEALVMTADKLHNLRSMRDDLRRIGDELWKRFNVGRDVQQWYYEGLADALASRPPAPMAGEFIALVRDVFGQKSPI